MTTAPIPETTMTLARPGPAARPAEPRLPGPRKLTAGARDVAALIDEDPKLWPALTTCATDTEGRTIVHYAAGHSDSKASYLFSEDGVVARWRAQLHDPQESRSERADGQERVLTLRGRHSGYAVTVLITVLTGDTALTGGTTATET